MLDVYIYCTLTVLADHIAQQYIGAVFGGFSSSWELYHPDGRIFSGHSLPAHASPDLTSDWIVSANSILIPEKGVIYQFGAILNDWQNNGGNETGETIIQIGQVLWPCLFI